MKKFFQTIWRHKLFVFMVIVLVGSVIYLRCQNDLSDADFFLKVLSAFGVVFAVLLALYGDAIKNSDISLSIQQAVQSDSIVNKGGPRIKSWSGDVFCHHLRVVNSAPYRPVLGCRVWLVKVLDVDPHGQISDSFSFAVPRLMEWAPSECSPKEGPRMNFSEDWVFDFGESPTSGGPFFLKWWKEQQGTFEGDCKVGESKRYIFRITADNYVAPALITVQVKAISDSKPEISVL